MAKQDAIKEGIGLLEDWGEKLADVISEYGPDAAELALALGRAGAIREVVGGLFFLSLAAAFAGLAFWSGRREIRAYLAGRKAGETETLITFTGGAGAAIFVFVAGTYLTNIYAWAGMFRPEIWLAAKALGWT